MSEVEARRRLCRGRAFSCLALTWLARMWLRWVWFAGGGRARTAGRPTECREATRRFVETTHAVARTGSGGGFSRRSPALALTVVLGLFASADEEDCLKLPKAEQPFCLMMLSCAAIDDAERRKECYDGVIARYQGEGTHADLQSVVEEPADPAARAEPAEPAELVEPPALAEPAERVQPPALAESPELAVPAAPVSREAERPWWRKVVRVPRLGRARTESPPAAPEPDPAVSVPTPPEVTERSIESTVLEIPKRFSAEVTDVRKLLYDRQLIVLDGKLVFETDRASYSRLKSGDSVKVVRTSAFLGERYSIAGSSGGSVRASRLRCESTELGAENRRKCDALLDQSSRASGR